MEIRGFTKNKSRERNATDLFKRAEADPDNNHIICEIQSIRLCLKRIMQINTKGAILRSKARWHEEGECKTSFFYILEKGTCDKRQLKN